MTPPESMRPGALLYDTATQQVGEYRSTQGGLLFLRPLGGGREWSAEAHAVRPPTDAERISAGVRAANVRSTGGLQ